MPGFFDIFAIRALPVFMTVLITLLSLSTHKGVMNQIKNTSEEVMILYTFLFGAIFAYTITTSFSAKYGDTKKSAWGIIMIILMSVTILYFLTYWELEDVLRDFRKSPELISLISIPIFIIPVVVFTLMEREKKYKMSGVITVLFSTLGLFGILLNSNYGGKNKKGQIIRMIVGIVACIFLLFSYVASYYIQFKQYHKLAFVFWFIMAVGTIVLNELPKKDIMGGTRKGLTANLWFSIISLLSFLSALTMYWYPTQGSFTQYSSTISTVTLLVGGYIIGAYLAGKEYWSALAWMWLLSFVNIAVIDGYIKFVQASRSVSAEYDSISLSVMSFPVMVNALLAFYTTLKAIQMSYNNESPRSVELLISLTVGTYVSAILSLLFNSGNLQQTIITEKWLRIDDTD